MVVMCSRTISLPRTVDPASTTPTPSIRQRLASEIAFCGMRSNETPWMNSMKAAVVPEGNVLLSAVSPALSG